MRASTVRSSGNALRARRRRPSSDWAAVSPRPIAASPAKINVRLSICRESLPSPRAAYLAGSGETQERLAIVEISHCDAPAGLGDLVAAIRSCRLCRDAPAFQPPLPQEPNPILRIDPRARLLIASQAPGLRAHLSSLPFDDPSGERLRQWMGLDRPRFYDGSRVLIAPMGFCFPGYSPRQGRPAAAPRMRGAVARPPVRGHAAGRADPGDRPLRPGLPFPPARPSAAAERSSSPISSGAGATSPAAIPRSSPCRTPPGATAAGSSATLGSTPTWCRPCARPSPRPEPARERRGTLRPRTR